MIIDSIDVTLNVVTKEITAKLNEQHDTIILTEIVEFCGQNDLLEYKVSVDTLREALNFYFEYRDRQKGKWIERFDDDDKWVECTNCHKDSDKVSLFCPNCGSDMR